MREKNLQKKHIYIQLNHFAVHLKLTQHCKSTIPQLKKKRDERILRFLNTSLYSNFHPLEKYTVNILVKPENILM